MMKTLLLFILIGLPGLCYSQTFSGGLNLGVNTSQIDGDAYWGYHRIGLFAGGFVNAYLSDDFGLQMELHFVDKGASKSNEIGDPAYYRVKLHYVELPLVVFYDVMEKVKISAGLTYGLLIKAEEDLSGTGYREPDPPFHKSDVNMLIGAEYFFLEKISVYSRFTYSIIPIREHPGGQTHFLDRGQVNNNISIALRYYFSR
jgi:hypothetical protein